MYICDRCGQGTFDPSDVGDGECARCHCRIKRNGGEIEFTANGLHVKWNHLCLQCASQIEYHLFERFASSEAPDDSSYYSTAEWQNILKEYEEYCRQRGKA